MQKCKDCGAVLYQWEIAKHKCPEEGKEGEVLVVSQEDLDANPELVEAGVEVGEELVVQSIDPVDLPDEAPEEAEEVPVVEEVPVKKTPAKKPAKAKTK